MTSPLRLAPFFDEATHTVTYLVWDANTGEAAAIDPVLDYAHASGQAHTGSADAVLAAAQAQGLRLRWILETHA
ncbi:MBL fold metallo-hydrolase, partial [Klebsiella pneumoniae]|nr:MBL fold metallo-hydrolase [Klebsiella pneumoniae]